MSTQFKCQICLDDEKPNNELVLVAGNPLCRECFERDGGPKSDFNAALQNEINYPVTYAGTTLDINDFADFFSAEFLTAYEIKLQEYAVPVSDRLYCNNVVQSTQQTCGHFIGSKAATNADSIRCPSCSTAELPVHVCTQCCNSFTGMVEDHTCTSNVDAFDGLTRGVDYQICPNATCQAKVQLWDGCHEMVCSLCNTTFCYVCGAHYHPGHFNFGMPCPRFGRSGDDEAIFDSPPSSPSPPPSPPPFFGPVMPAWMRNERLATHHRQLLAGLDFTGIPEAAQNAQDVQEFITLLSEQIEIYNFVSGPQALNLPAQLDENRQQAYDRLREIGLRLSLDWLGSGAFWDTDPGTDLWDIYVTYRDTALGLNNFTGLVLGFGFTVNV